MNLSLFKRILSDPFISSRVCSSSASELLDGLASMDHIRSKDYYLKASIPHSCDVHETSLLRGLITMGKNVKVGRNVRIVGNVTIGDNVIIQDDCFLRGDVLLCKNTNLGRGVEIKSSLVGRHSSIGPLSFVGSSIVGSHVMLGALVRTSNVRLDDEEIAICLGDISLNCGVDFGCVMGDNVNIGLQSSVMPGRIIPRDSQLPPATVFRSFRQLKTND